MPVFLFKPETGAMRAGDRSQRIKGYKFGGPKQDGQGSKMKVQFEPEDIEAIARSVAGYVKALISDQGKNREPQDEVLTIEQVATLLKTSKAQIYQWVNNSQHGIGTFPYLKAGRLLRFSRREVLQWLEGARKG